MTRKYSWLLFIVIGLLSVQCNRPKEFSVTGILTGAENDTLVLDEMVENGLNSIRSVYTDDRGAFSFSDTAQNPRFLFLKTQEHYISLLVLNGQKIELSGDLSDLNTTFKISGSRESELIWELNIEMQKAAVELDSLIQIYQEMKSLASDQEADVWFSRKYQDLVNDQKDYVRRFINDHYDSPASLMALSHQLNRQSVLNPAADYAYFARVDSALSEKYPNSAMVQTLHTWVLSQRQQQSLQEAQEKTVGIGSEAPDIQLENPEGERISLSSFRGKYVLLDFWAAWCAPCRRENPNLVTAYKKFNPSGFEIFQVSLDRTREEWVRAIESDQLTWTHVSDLKFWSSPVAKLYYVNSIPASFLIDPDGIIIARNLRGPALHQKLSEIFD